MGMEDKVGTSLPQRLMILRKIPKLCASAFLLSSSALQIIVAHCVVLRIM